MAVESRGRKIQVFVVWLGTCTVLKLIKNELEKLLSLYWEYGNREDFSDAHLQVEIDIPATNGIINHKDENSLIKPEWILFEYSFSQWKQQLWVGENLIDDTAKCEINWHKNVE